MPRFEYQSLTAQGQPRQGVLEAATRSEVVRTLLARGETATTVQPVAANTPQRASAPRTVAKEPRRQRIKPAELATLVRELATALEAGLPLLQALTTLRRQISPRLAPMLDHLIERVEAGDPLHKAAMTWGPPFNDLVTGMIRASDASGQQHVVLHQLADLLERQVELKREVMGAALYPLIVAGLIVVSVIILVTVLIPTLMEPLKAAGMTELPLPTRILLGLADVLTQWWIFIVLGLIAISAFWKVWVAAPENRLRFDRWKLRQPVVGRLLRDVAVARFTRTMGTLSGAGLSILECLRITRDTLGNTAMTAAIDEVTDSVTEGRPLAEPLERSGLFPPLLVQVVNLGERSGRLEQMLEHASTAFDRQVEASLKIFTKAFPPLMIIIMACIGGFVLAAILLPLMELQKLMG
ncbi:MAG: type II secretion system F family protein [Phycisphaerales bacterium]|nr:type II secretion system F family protein [Phycisphaerales bacterium]